MTGKEEAPASADKPVKWTRDDAPGSAVKEDIQEAVVAAEDVKEAARRGPVSDETKEE